MFLRRRRLDGAPRIGCFDKVGRMACIARNPIEVVLGPVKLRLVLTRDVAAHASRRILRRICMEREDQFFRRFDLRVIPFTVHHSFRVRFARTVARLAARPVRGIRRRCLRVDGLRELFSLRDVTIQTHLSAGEILRLSSGRFPGYREIFVSARLPLGESKTDRRR